MSTTAKFPSDFHWGYATASAQVEGSVSDPTWPLVVVCLDGKSPSIWDTFSADPNHSEDGGSTATATETYKKWEQDIALMKSYGVNSYRLSLSWTRIIPGGRKGDAVNQSGVEWYRKVLKGLLHAGIVSGLGTASSWRPRLTIETCHVIDPVRGESSSIIELLAR
jgi:beta-glucosidase